MALVQQTRMSDDKYERHRIISEILKAHRERKNMTQREIMSRLGYKNPNYISMIEKNRSTIPVARVADFVKAYELPRDFIFSMLREIYPDVLRMMSQLFVVFSSEAKDLEYDTILERAAKELNELKEEYRIK